MAPTGGWCSAGLALVLALLAASVASSPWQLVLRGNLLPRRAGVVVVVDVWVGRIARMVRGHLCHCSRKRSSSSMFGSATPGVRHGLLPDLTDAHSMVVAWLFRDIHGYPIVLQERKAAVPADLLPLLAGCDPSTGHCQHVGRSVHGVEGSVAVVLDGREAGGAMTSVTWVQDGVEVFVVGPSSSFTAESGLGISTELLRGGGS